MEVRGELHFAPLYSLRKSPRWVLDGSLDGPGGGVNAVRKTRMFALAWN